MEKIKIERNTKQYLLVDQNDNELGVIEIDVTDFDFFNRTKKAEKNISEILEKLKNLKEQSVQTEEAFEQLAVYDRTVKEQLNMMFDYDVSSVVFGNRNCLSIGNGETFVARFMEAILPAIKKDIEKEQKKSVQKMSKYTKGYAK